jgi:hypothetical protein
MGTKVLVHNGHEWARKCWSARGMSGHESATPHKGMFYLSSSGTLTFIKMLETCVENALATERVQSTMAGRFFCFGESD